MSSNSPNRKNLIRLAKARVGCWYDSTRQSAELRQKLLRGIDAVGHELPRRLGWFEVMTVSLDGGLPIRLDGLRHRAYPCTGCLAVSSVVPGWGFGWREIFKDEDVYDVLSWFLHYARQYVHRSDVASVLMAVFEVHGQILHPFGSRSMAQRYGPVVPMVSVDRALDDAEEMAVAAWGKGHERPRKNPTASSWVRRNTLDPFIHQAVFHYLRGQDLKAHGFNVDAVVAFDCVFQSIASFLQARCRLPKLPTRRQLCDQLQLSTDAGDLAEYVYFLRNNFGAHVGGWRWWDHSEILGEEQIADIAGLAGSILSSAADQESQIRLVEPFPADWAEWFFKNFEMLWDTVWWDKLDKWMDRQIDM